MLFNLPTAGYAPLLLSLLLGTPALSALGSIGAALTLSVRRGGLVLALIVLPLISARHHLWRGLGPAVVLEGSGYGAFFLVGCVLRCHGGAVALCRSSRITAAFGELISCRLLPM